MLDLVFAVSDQIPLKIAGKRPDIALMDDRGLGTFNPGEECHPPFPVRNSNIHPPVLSRTMVYL
jgi:hypothetical protein